MFHLKLIKLKKNMGAIKQIPSISYLPCSSASAFTGLGFEFKTLEWSKSPPI